MTNFHLKFKNNIRRTIPLILLVTCMLFFNSCQSKRGAVNDQKSYNEIEVIKIHVSNTRQALLDEAYTWIGTPYKYAAQNKNVGTDCSGMVMEVYRNVSDLKLPRNSAKQAEFCEKIKHSDILPGDLVFFATGKDPNRVSHVGIIIDNDNFIHASSSKGVVVSKLSSNYYQRTFRMFGRVPGIK